MSKRAKQSLTKRIKAESDDARATRLIARLSEKSRKKLGLDKVGEP